MSKDFSIAFVSAEAAPFSQTGGLGDVIPALAEAFVLQGVSVDVYLPCYKKNTKLKGAPFCEPFVVDPLISKVKTQNFFIERNGVRYIFVKSPGICTEGEYGDENGAFADNCRRFSLFCRSVIKIWELSGTSYDVIHCHDWQSGLIPPLVKENSISGQVVFTIHNLAFQGDFDSNFIAYTGLKKYHFEFEGNSKLNFMRCALKYSDKITTVSPTYGKEITEVGRGEGMESLLRSRQSAFCGILNGIDTQEWNPQQDPYLIKPYSADDFSGKTQCKKAFLKKVGLSHPEKPLFVMISRLAHQKGIEALYGTGGAIERLLQKGSLNIAVIGTGERWVEEKIKSLDEQYSHFCGMITFSSQLSHEAEAAADFFLMPSLYEPCGLNQLYSLRYGAIPLVTKTGGLADTVCVEGDLSIRTGVRIPGFGGDDVVTAVEEALSLYEAGPQVIDAIRRNGMIQDFSWDCSSQRYLKFYKE